MAVLPVESIITASSRPMDGPYRRFFDTRLDDLEEHLTTMFLAMDESPDRKMEHDVPDTH